MSRSDTATLSLSPGTYFFSLDTYVSSGTAQAGEYIFVVTED